MAEQTPQFISRQAQRVRSQQSRQQEATPVAKIQGSIQGGGGGRAPAIAHTFDRSALKQDRTIEMIAELGLTTSQDALERRQREQFIDGARRQFEGEALGDIVQEQPWYTKIFGPSASSQGARTMAKMSAVEGFSAKLEQDMPELRKLDSEQFKTEMLNRMDEAAVFDDAATNAAVQEQLLSSMGPAVRSHTKEHFTFVQEQMQQEFTGALTSAAGTLQQASQGLNRGTLSPKDYQFLQANAAQALQPLDGQTPASYWSAVEASTEEAMAQGNFHFVNIVQDTLYDSMPVEQRTKFLNDRRKYENQTVSDMAVGEFSVDIAKLRAYSSEGQISPQATLGNINAINQKFRNQTGLDRDLIDGKQAEGIISGNLKGIIKEQKAARKAAAAAANKQNAERAQLLQETQEAQMLFLSGNAQSLIEQGGDKQVVQNTAAATLRQQMQLEANGEAAEGSWAVPVVQNNNDEGFKVVALERQIKSGVRASIGEDYGPQFEQSYNLWRQIYEQPGGETAAADYAGEYAGQMEAYHMERITGTQDPSMTHNLVFNTPPSPSGTATTEDTKAVMGALKKKYHISGLNWGGKEELNDSGVRVLATTAADEVVRIRQALPGLSEDAIAQRALATVRGKVDVVGEYAYQRNPDDVALHNYLGVTNEEAGIIFGATIDDKLKATGSTGTDSYVIQRARDQVDEEGNAVPTFAIMAYDDDLVPHYTVIRGEELMERINEPKLGRRPKPKRTDGVLGGDGMRIGQ